MPASRLVVGIGCQDTDTSLILITKKPLRLPISRSKLLALFQARIKTVTFRWPKMDNEHPCVAASHPHSSSPTLEF